MNRPSHTVSAPDSIQFHGKQELQKSLLRVGPHLSHKERLERLPNPVFARLAVRNSPLGISTEHQQLT